MQARSGGPAELKRLHALFGDISDKDERSFEENPFGDTRVDSSADSNRRVGSGMPAFAMCSHRSSKISSRIFYDKQKGRDFAALETNLHLRSGGGDRPLVVTCIELP